MKIQVERANLVQALQKVQNITEKKSNMPILSNVLIRATDLQNFELSATDLELSFKTQVGALIEDPGNFTVQARKLLEIVRELPQEHVLLETEPNDRLSIHAGRSHFELATIAWEDFPQINFYPDVHYLTCEGSALRDCFGKTFYGIPSEEDPFSVSGLFLHPVEPDALRFVASDGHRLSYVEVPLNTLSGLDTGSGIIIPRKGVQEILRLIEKETEVFLGIHENCMMVKAENSLLSIQLLESDFPEYQLIIPEERPFAFAVDWGSLYSALKRMAILTTQKWRHVRFVINEGTLELESGSQEIGNANDVLDIEYEGEPFNIAFNIRYVLEAIQVLESHRIRFEWVDQFHGAVFLSPDDPAYFSLIMPMVI